jgi:tetratricopeptide (TPR) repeat protein
MKPKTGRKSKNYMKYILTTLILLISASVFAQQMSYDDWKEQAKTEIRLLPEYGNAQKTAGQIAADEELIRTELKAEGTHRKASDHLIKVGFDYLYRGDLKTAMYRFNQAWLLDPKNENVYWGFGAIYFVFNDYREALNQYNDGLQLNPNSSNILTDKGTIYLTQFEKDHDEFNLSLALGNLNQSYKITPSNQNTLLKLSVAYFYNKDCSNAWRFYNECMKLGGQPITREFTEALKKLCNK